MAPLASSAMCPIVEHDTTSHWGRRNIHRSCFAGLSTPEGARSCLLLMAVRFEFSFLGVFQMSFWRIVVHQIRASCLRCPAKAFSRLVTWPLVPNKMELSLTGICIGTVEGVSLGKLALQQVMEEADLVSG